MGMKRRLIWHYLTRPMNTSEVHNIETISLFSKPVIISLMIIRPIMNVIAFLLAITAFFVVVCSPIIISEFTKNWWWLMLYPVVALIVSLMASLNTYKEYERNHKRYYSNK